MLAAPGLTGPAHGSRNRLADVELPDGRHLEHRIIRTLPGAGAVVTDEHKRVLLLWCHRFITDTRGWEIPVGRAEPAEDLAEAAAGEVRLASCPSMDADPLWTTWSADWLRDDVGVTVGWGPSTC